MTSTRTEPASCFDHLTELDEQRGPRGAVFPIPVDKARLLFRDAVIPGGYVMREGEPAGREHAWRADEPLIPSIRMTGHVPDFSAYAWYQARTDGSTEVVVLSDRDGAGLLSRSHGTGILRTMLCLSQRFPHSRWMERASIPVAAASLVPSGTPIRLVSEQSVSGRSVEVGDVVRLAVAEDVFVGGTRAIARGADATARVTSRHAPGPFGQTGSVEFELIDVRAVDGAKLSLQPQKVDRSNSPNVGGIVAASVLFGVAGAAMAFGSNVGLLPGVEIDAVVVNGGGADSSQARPTFSAPNAGPSTLDDHSK